MRERLLELRGVDYVAAMEAFYAKLPYIFTSKYFFACHAGPPLSNRKYNDPLHIADHPDLIREITKNRLQRPNYPGGTTKMTSKNSENASLSLKVRPLWSVTRRWILLVQCGKMSVQSSVII